MSKYMVLHTFKTSVEAFNAAFSGEAIAQFAEGNALGNYPAQCLTTFDPTKHGRRNMMVCIWQGDSADKVLQTIKQVGLDQLITSDIMLVDETDWLNLAQETQ